MKSLGDENWLLLSNVLIEFSQGRVDSNNHILSSNKTVGLIFWIGQILFLFEKNIMISISSRLIIDLKKYLFILYNISELVICYLVFKGFDRNGRLTGCSCILIDTDQISQDEAITERCENRMKKHFVSMRR